MARMSRRVVALVIAATVVVVLLAVAVALPVPYVVLGPGPTLNTLGTDSAGKRLITVTNHRVYRTTGHLNMVTVGYEGGPGAEINVYSALNAWLNPHKAVVPQAELFTPGQSQQAANQQELAEMTGSQQHAEAAALQYLGIHYTTRVTVVTTTKGLPAHKVLHRGDAITALDGSPVTGVNSLVELIAKHASAGSVLLTVVRHGGTRQIRVPVARSGGRPVIGVVPATSYKFPFEVSYAVGQIGGPSAGMMFALGIIDKITPMDLTGGRFIAGTGEIQPDGTVVEIGGIQQKMVGARDKGATIFLTPAGNCAAAKAAVPSGLRLVKVQTLGGAVRDLEALRAGKQVPSC